MFEATTDQNLASNPIQYVNYDKPISGTLANNGHSIVFTYDANATGENGENYLPTISNGSLPGTFVFDQLHFHWGSQRCQGSEHVLEFYRAPLELHIVHHNAKYGSLSDAVSHPDGLAVLGYLITDLPHRHWVINGTISDISSKLNAVTNNGASVLSGLPNGLNSLVEKYSSSSKAPFFRYAVSLTTPPCSESVTWTVFSDMMVVDSAEIGAFRTVEASHGVPLVDNFRPIQRTNRRKVRTNSKAFGSTGVSLDDGQRLILGVPVRILPDDQDP